MKKLFLLALAFAGMTSCQNDDATTADSSFAIKASGADYAAAALLPVQTVSGDITTATTWTSDKVWEIDGVVRVKGALLTIQPGTYIKAKPAANNVATGVLVITKTGSISALGTVSAPVVFTSYRLLDNNAATAPVPGDFGGVILLGNAEVNTGVDTNIIEGLGDQANSQDFYYGGVGTGGNGHNAGTIQYARIEYAGRKLPTQGNNGVEINGLTCGGVGSGTTLNHIQVSWGLDDAYEFFGGTVNASYLVAFSNDDDSFDFDWGYKGSITKAISIANKNSTHSTSTGPVPDSNGIELDNNATGTTGMPATLITRPVITDLSIVGFKDSISAAALENGIHVRRLGQIALTRATTTGYGAGTNAGLRWDVNPTLSSKSALSVHGFASYVLPVVGTYTLAQLVGPSANTSTAASAPTWNTSATFQPFYNEPNFSLAGGNTGAFATEANWTATWTIF